MTWLRAGPPTRAHRQTSTSTPEGRSTVPSSRSFATTSRAEHEVDPQPALAHRESRRGAEGAGTRRGGRLDGVAWSGPRPGGPAERLLGVVAVFAEALAVVGAGRAALGMVHDV